MDRKATILFYTYIAIAALALILTWAHSLDYFREDMLLGNVRFWQDAVSELNPANRFLLIDLFFLAFAASIWMVIESRRLGISYVWAYIALGVFVAFSCAFPLFLAARERQLALVDKKMTNITIHSADIVGLSLFFLVVIGVGFYLL